MPRSTDHRPLAGGRIAPPPRKREALRNDFDPTWFENAILDMGYRVQWEHAARCPCRNNRETSQPRAMCPVCDGTGWEYHTSQEIRAIVDGMDMNRDAMIAFGQWTFGAARITVRHEHRPGFQDRYTLLDSVVQFTELRIRAAVRERLRYDIATVHMDLLVEHPSGDLVKRPAVPIDVMRCRLMDPSSLEPGRVVQRGEDFDVIGGRIDWSKGDQRGTAPKVGESYAVTYYHHPRYIVITYNHVVRDTRLHVKSPVPDTRKWQPLPIEVMAKLDFDTAQPGGGFGG